MSAQVLGGSVNWYGKIKKEAAEDLVGNENGNFMFREGKKGKGYTVCVVFKGKRTHHQVTEEAGKLAINGKVTEATTIKELEEELNRKRPELKWPAPLLNGIANPELAGKEEEEVEEEEEVVAEEDPEPEADTFSDDGGDGQTTSIKLAQKLPEGAERLPRLNSVKRNPKPAAVANADVVDFKDTLQAVGDRADITHIEGPEEVEAEWNINGGEDDSGDEDEDLRLEGDFEECPNAAKQSGKEVDASMGQFYHGAISEAEAEALILSQPNAKAGTFLFGNEAGTNVYFVSVLEISKGAVSYRVRHNKIVPNTKSKAEYDVNGRPTGQGTLAALAKYLQRRQPGFKDPLTAGILGFAMVTDVMLESRLEAEAVTQQAKVDDEASAKAADIAAHREKTKEASARYKAGASTDQEESEQRLAEVGTASLQDAREIAAVEVSRIRQKQLLEKKRNELIAQKSAEFAEDVQTLNKALEHADLLKRSGSPEEPDSDSDEEAPDDAATDVWKPMKRRGSFNGTGGTPPAIMHPVMDELEAYGWLHDGGAEEGKYLLRQVKKPKNNYILDVIIEGKPKSFSVAQDKAGSFFKEFRVDGQVTGTTSIDSCIEWLHTAHGTWWVVPLLLNSAVKPRNDKKQSKRVKKEQKSRRN